MTFKPDFPKFKKLTHKGNLIAVTKTVPADLETPVSGFLKLAGSLVHAFLLESAEQGEHIGRYSVIGLEPERVLSQIKAHIDLTVDGRKRRLQTAQSLINLLEASLQGQKLANPEALPEFCGGYVGYFSYENVEHFEKIKLSHKQGPSVPDAIFFLTRHFLIFDHFRKTLTAVVIAKIDNPGRAQTVYEASLRTIERDLARLRRPLKLKRRARELQNVRFVSNITRGLFEKKVRKIKEYIRAGDCIQVVFSQRFMMYSDRDDFQIYRALRSINPSPYMFYFRCGKVRLIGASPELLVKNKGRLAELRPIAGTRPRGDTEKGDRVLRESLLGSHKEMAEHLMLVDLGRNDLGRVCEFNSVRVKNFARVENYSHVMHLVSDVVGKLKNGKNSFDLLKAAFPAGTVTGAPKIRAMQIIDELETEKRGPYAGCLGYFSFNRDMEVCITIRTLVVEGNKVYLQAGAGIVKDSNPAREYQETLNKAKALVQAIKDQGDF